MTNSIAKHENGVILLEAGADKSCHGAIDPCPGANSNCFCVVTLMICESNIEYGVASFAVGADRRSAIEYCPGAILIRLCVAALMICESNPEYGVAFFEYRANLLCHREIEPCLGAFLPRLRVSATRICDNISEFGEVSLHGSVNKYSFGAA